MNKPVCHCLKSREGIVRKNRRMDLKNYIWRLTFVDHGDNEEKNVKGTCKRALEKIVKNGLRTFSNLHTCDSLLIASGSGFFVVYFMDCEVWQVIISYISFIRHIILCNFM